jgi:hypothetical protein
VPEDLLAVLVFVVLDFTVVEVLDFPLLVPLLFELELELPTVELDFVLVESVLPTLATWVFQYDTNAASASAS